MIIKIDNESLKIVAKNIQPNKRHLLVEPINPCLFQLAQGAAAFELSLFATALCFFHQS